MKRTTENIDIYNISEGISKSAKRQRRGGVQKGQGASFTDSADSILHDDSDSDKLLEHLDDDMSESFTVEHFKSFTPDNKKESIPPEGDVLTYDKIKNKTAFDEFETPYIYMGKKGKHMRYRLSLPNEKNPKKARTVKSILNFISTLLIALIIALFLRSFVFMIATVDGPSMQNTLFSNEKLIVTRYTYYFHEIERGDIIVCRYPTPNYPDYYVKRVIALGGDKIEAKGGVVYVNDVALTEDYTGSYTHDFDALYVDEGYVFVMGDNRSNSADSRSVGQIPVGKVVGKVRCIVFPFSKIGSLED